MTGLVGLLIIFLAKVVEVTLTTMRMLYLNKGAKFYAAGIGFIEVLIWIKVASVVLEGINENPAQMFVYALGFAAGSYVGMMIEDKIGLGYSRLEIITNETDGSLLANEIRALGKAVTISKSSGRDGENVVLSTFLRRKTKELVLNKAKEMDIKGVITVSEIQKVYGGFGLK